VVEELIVGRPKELESGHGYEQGSSRPQPRSCVRQQRDIIIDMLQHIHQQNEVEIPTDWTPTKS
jgi:hypothetical protein